MSCGKGSFGVEIAAAACARTVFTAMGISTPQARLERWALPPNGTRQALREPNQQQQTCWQWFAGVGA